MGSEARYFTLSLRHPERYCAQCKGSALVVAIP